MTIVGQDFISTGWQNYDYIYSNPRYSGIFSALSPTGSDGTYRVTSSSHIDLSYYQYTSSYQYRLCIIYRSRNKYGFFR